MTSSPKPLAQSIGVFANVLRHQEIREVYRASGGKPVVEPKPLFPDPQTHQVWHRATVAPELR